MRILASALIILSASAMSLPAAACDMHGGGMFDQLIGSAWLDHSPAEAEANALLSEEELNEVWGQPGEGVNPDMEERPAPEKPNFSTVSSRASLAAQQRLKTKAKAIEPKQAQSAPSSKSEGETKLASR